MECQQGPWEEHGGWPCHLYGTATEWLGVLLVIRPGPGFDGAPVKGHRDFLLGGQQISISADT